MAGAVLWKRQPRNGIEGQEGQRSQGGTATDGTATDGNKSNTEIRNLRPGDN
jgi:hypothetical protein